MSFHLVCLVADSCTNPITHMILHTVTEDALPLTIRTSRQHDPTSKTDNAQVPCHLQAFSGACFSLQCPYLHGWGLLL